MTAETGAVTARQAFTPLEAFSGAIARTETGPLYSAGLAIVAFAMVLLPLIYLALIPFTAWAVLFHLMHDTWIFEGASGRGGSIGSSRIQAYRPITGARRRRGNEP